MDILILIARLLHVVLGAFWFGAVMFNTLFLGPALQDVGPDAAKVGAAMVRRKVMTFMPTAAMLTILSGLWLYWRMSGGFTPGYMGSPQGQALGLGAVAAIVAIILGFTMVKPGMEKAAALGQRAGQASGSERDALMAQSQALRTRAGKASNWVAGLITLTIITMAVARYL